MECFLTTEVTRRRLAEFIAEVTGYGEEFVVLSASVPGRPAAEYTVADFCARLALPSAPTTVAPMTVTEPHVVAVLVAQFGVARDAITPDATLGALLGAAGPPTR